MTCLQHFNIAADRANHVLPERSAAQTASMRLVADVPQPRLQLIARIRRELAQGTYDIDGKFDRVIDRLLDLL